MNIFSYIIFQFVNFLKLKLQKLQNVSNNTKICQKFVKITKFTKNGRFHIPPHITIFRFRPFFWLVTIIFDVWYIGSIYGFTFYFKMPKIKIKKR